MSECGVGPRFYNEPPPNIIHLYQQLGDGCWYPKEFERAFTEEERTEAMKWERDQKGISPAVEDGLMDALQDIAATNLVNEFGAQTPSGIGDVNSDEKGSGARFNTGKPPMQYIPFEQQLIVFGKYFDDRPECDYLRQMMRSLSLFEQGDDSALSYLVHNLEVTDLHAAAFVWEYGANKYSAWNWAKGMPWSVPLACISRHIQAILIEREELDAESECEHWGHIVCNLLMLDHYSRYYREGDDRPPASIFEVES